MRELFGQTAVNIGLGTSEKIELFSSVPLNVKLCKQCLFKVVGILEYLNIKTNSQISSCEFLCL